MLSSVEILMVIIGVVLLPNQDHCTATLSNIVFFPVDDINVRNNFCKEIHAKR